MITMQHRETRPVGVPPGTVVELRDGEWKYGTGPLTLRVARVRWELAQYYDGEVWVMGYRLDVAGAPVEQRTVLVRCAALSGGRREHAIPRGSRARPDRRGAGRT